MTDPVAEPAAYWTGVAHRALIAFTRAREAELGLTHPQFCLLRALTERDARTLPDLTRDLRAHLLTTDDLAAEAEALLDRRLITVDGHGRLRITPAGHTARDEQSRHLPEITARIHAGIPDADYDAALTVLRQIITNVS
ncbi:MarR family transcriptional regulator [Actinoplanes missouriensis]|uniref:MarR family transcriptional regulator n=1 Tax=Actinoplanes missouriensis TaxID=1866 RepID=UPI0033F3367E